MQCKNCGNKITSSGRFCPNCGASLHVEQTNVGDMNAAKKSSSNKRVAMIVFPLVLIAGTAIFVAYLNPSVNSVIKSQPVVAPVRDYDSNAVSMATVAFREDKGELVFSLKDLLQHTLVRFEYKGGQTPRVVMAYLAPTGQVVTSISVSEHCGSTEFKIKNNKIFCAHCPSNWDMMTMEAYACCAKYHPDPVPSRVIGDEVRVSKVFIEKWAGRL